MNIEIMSLALKIVLSLFGYVDRSSRLLIYCLGRGRESTFESPMRMSLDLLSSWFCHQHTDCGVCFGDNLALY
jgi:hypothetical protein